MSVARTQTQTLQAIHYLTAIQLNYYLLKIMDESLVLRMATALEIIAGMRQLDDSSTPKPGFAPLPEPQDYRTIYAKRDGEYFWHMLSKEVNPKTGNRSKILLAEPHQQSFIGRLSNIEIVETTRKDKHGVDGRVLKAYIVLEGDIPTKIETNPETGFFRSFVAIAADLTPEQFSKDIQIVPTPAKASPGKVSFDTVMWCSIYDLTNGVWCRGADWSKKKYSEIDWDDRIDSLIATVRQLNSNSQANGVMGDPKRYTAEPEDIDIFDGSESETPEPLPAIQPDPKPPVDPKPSDLSDLIAESAVELERIGWTPEQGREHLKKTYKKGSRSRLTEDELMNFLEHLRVLPASSPETQGENDALEKIP